LDNLFIVIPLDEGLLKAMKEVATEDEVDYEEVRELIKLL